MVQKTTLQYIRQALDGFIPILGLQRSVRQKAALRKVYARCLAYCASHSRLLGLLLAEGRMVARMPTVATAKQDCHSTAATNVWLIAWAHGCEQFLRRPPISISCSP